MESMKRFKFKYFLLTLNKLESYLKFHTRYKIIKIKLFSTKRSTVPRSTVPNGCLAALRNVSSSHLWSENFCISKFHQMHSVHISKYQEIYIYICTYVRRRKILWYVSKNLCVRILSTRRSGKLLKIPI